MSQPIVSDAGPWITFARAGQLSLLQEVVRHLVVPDAVYDEIAVKGANRPGAAELINAGWVECRSVADPAPAGLLARTLGRGEREAISLAIELGGCLLADDPAARREAKARSIPLISTLDVLDEAKLQAMTRAVRPLLDALIRSGFRLKRTLYDAKLHHAGEAPS
jgi:predicted nucleic acid-binding protein